MVERKEGGGGWGGGWRMLVNAAGYSILCTHMNAF